MNFVITLNNQTWYWALGYSANCLVIDSCYLFSEIVL